MQKTSEHEDQDARVSFQNTSPGSETSETHSVFNSNTLFHSRPVAPVEEALWDGLYPDLHGGNDHVIQVLDLHDGLVGWDWDGLCHGMRAEP